MHDSLASAQARVPRCDQECKACVRGSKQLGATWGPAAPPSPTVSQTEDYILGRIQMPNYNVGNGTGLSKSPTGNLKGLLSLEFAATDKLLSRDLIYLDLIKRRWKSTYIFRAQSGPDCAIGRWVLPRRFCGTSDFDFPQQRPGSIHLPLAQSGFDCCGEVLCPLQGLTTP